MKVEGTTRYPPDPGASQCEVTTFPPCLTWFASGIPLSRLQTGLGHLEAHFFALSLASA
jgi:hypothetical protein